MPQGNSLINFGDISKPATVFIEKLFDAVGWYFEPRQIKRIAKAEAEAELIKAQAKIEVSDLQQRARKRSLAEEIKHQENMEKIITKTIPEITESSRPHDLDDDWIANFFDKSRIISDEEMQSLWAKILAGETNSPGSYSKRTVNFLSSLNKKEANLFTSLCGFCLTVGDLVPLIYNVEHSIYNNNGISFETLTHLDDIGLISFQSIGGYPSHSSKGAIVTPVYMVCQLAQASKKVRFSQLVERSFSKKISKQLGESLEADSFDQ